MDAQSHSCLVTPRGFLFSSTVWPQLIKTTFPLAFLFQCILSSSLLYTHQLWKVKKHTYRHVHTKRQNKIITKNNSCACLQSSMRSHVYTKHTPIQNHWPRPLISHPPPHLSRQQRKWSTPRWILVFLCVCENVHVSYKYFNTTLLSPLLSFPFSTSLLSFFFS